MFLKHICVCLDETVRVTVVWTGHLSCVQLMRAYELERYF